MLDNSTSTQHSLTSLEVLCSHSNRYKLKQQSAYSLHNSGSTVVAARRLLVSTHKLRSIYKLRSSIAICMPHGRSWQFLGDHVLCRCCPKKKLTGWMITTRKFGRRRHLDCNMTRSFLNGWRRIHSLCKLWLRFLRNVYSSALCNLSTGCCDLHIQSRLPSDSCLWFAGDISKMRGTHCSTHALALTSRQQKWKASSGICFRVPWHTENMASGALLTAERAWFYAKL